MQKLDRAYESCYKPGNIVLYKMAPGVTIYKGSLVAINPNGLVIPMSAMEGEGYYQFAGVAEETVINDGDYGIRVSKIGSFLYNCEGAKQEHIGSEVQAIGDSTVQIYNPDAGQYEYMIVGTVIDVNCGGWEGEKYPNTVRVRIGNRTV